MLERRERRETKREKGREIERNRERESRNNGTEILKF